MKPTYLIQIFQFYWSSSVCVCMCTRVCAHTCVCVVSVKFCPILSLVCVGLHTYHHSQDHTTKTLTLLESYHF